jgi:hypothetical protein
VARAIQEVATETVVEHIRKTAGREDDHDTETREDSVLSSV